MSDRDYFTEQEILAYGKKYGLAPKQTLEEPALKEMREHYEKIIFTEREKQRLLLKGLDDFSITIEAAIKILETHIKNASEL